MKKHLKVPFAIDTTTNLVNQNVAGALPMCAIDFRDRVTLDLAAPDAEYGDLGAHTVDCLECLRRAAIRALSRTMYDVQGEREKVARQRLRLIVDEAIVFRAYLDVTVAADVVATVAAAEATLDMKVDGDGDDNGEN